MAVKYDLTLYTPIPQNGQTLKQFVHPNYES